ncbi:MAG: ribonuclease R [Bacteroidales bacterium]|nr:ribonuclease R [Bacteroidales bacterium]
MARKRNSKDRKAGKSSFAKTVLNVFMQNPVKGFNFRQLSFNLGISDKASKQLVMEILEDLAADRKIIEQKRGKYQLNPKLLHIPVSKSTITGTVDMKQTGKAYIISDESTEDIYIAANNTYHALNDDTVKVQIFPKRKDRKLEGRIVEIIKRSKTRFVGIVDVSKNYAFLIPDNNAVPIDIYIPAADLNGAKNGDKAIAEIVDWPAHSKNPFGKITEVLGKPGEHEVEMHSILADFGFPVRFPAKVEKEADKIEAEVSQKETNSRRDFRNIFTCTIDPEDAKDYDDALSLQKLNNGNWEVGVHIADVSYYVKPGTLIDQEAYDRGTSVYLVDRVIPMLPERLSNDICSLKPHTDKLCYAAIFEMTGDAQVESHWFGRTIINSNRRFNYDEVQEIIEGKQDEFSIEILTLHNLASKLRDERFKNGSIAFSSQEVKFKLDEDGKPISAYIKEQKDSNKLIEDFMLLANRRVAEWVGKVKAKQDSRTFVYRIHDVPNQEKLETFAEFINKLGYKLNLGSKKSISASLNQLFKDIKGKGEENMIESIAVRTMAKAEYSIKNIGHYGLAFSFYTHFTSPIRRYPDLMVHRLLDGYLNGNPVMNPAEYEEKCKHSSEMERKALEAERASIKYKQAEYMLDKVGQTFNGLISGVSKWGIYVELEGNKCEGMVSLRYMDDDFYYLDEENYRVIGHQFGKEYKLGDPVTIRVRKIELAKKQMDFEFV